jgi:acetyltransferase-like isoleucine patch superfamily enzyme
VPLTLAERLRLRVISRMAHRRLVRDGVTMGSGIVLHGAPIVELVPGSAVTLGDRVVLTSDSRRTALGVSHPVVVRTLHRDAVITIGNDVGISGGSICSAARIEIGDGTLLGANVTVADTNFHPIRDDARRYAPTPDPRSSDAITIGRNVFIGTGAYILRGVTIGNDAVIGAGAIVREDVQDGSVFL